MSTSMAYLEQITIQPPSDLTLPVHSIPTLTANRLRLFSLPTKSRSRRDTSNKIALYVPRALTPSRRSNCAHISRWTSIQRNINLFLHQTALTTVIAAVAPSSSVKTRRQTILWSATAAPQTCLAQDQLAVHIQLLVSKVCRLPSRAYTQTQVARHAEKRTASHPLFTMVVVRSTTRTRRAQAGTLEVALIKVLPVLV
jgi:hypothetical protein